MADDPNYFFPTDKYPADFTKSINLIIAETNSNNLMKLIRRQVDDNCAGIIFCGPEATEIESYADDYIVSDYHNELPSTVTMNFSISELDDAINLLMIFSSSKRPEIRERNIFVLNNLVQEEKLRNIIKEVQDSS